MHLSQIPESVTEFTSNFLLQLKMWTPVW